MSDDGQLRELQLIFLDEAKGFLAEAETLLMSLESSGFDIDLVNNAFRMAHNFKGSALSVGFDKLGQLAHRYEDVLTAIKKGALDLDQDLITAMLRCNDKLKDEITSIGQDSAHQTIIEPEYSELLRVLESKTAKHQTASTSQAKQAEESGFGFFDETPLRPEVAPKANTPIPPKIAKTPAASDKAASTNEETLKIPASRLDKLLNIIGEVVVNQSILDDCRTHNATDSAVALDAIGYMSKLVSDLQNLSVSLRLAPIKPLFMKLRRIVRDVSATLNKQVEFIEIGEECELDKGVIEKIADPLTHMIRNAIDHGVDTPEERKSIGKSDTATVRLEARVLDDSVKIIIADDGRGLNPEKITKKALESGIIAKGQTLSESEIYKLIFAPGFSTKDQVTDVSGRGVGMEVVQRAIDELKGTIEISSSLARGTQFTITLPLSLSIIGGMVIVASGNSYVVPVSHLVETIELSNYPIKKISGTGSVVNLRGEIVPVYNLSDLLSRRSKQKDRTEKEDKSEDEHTPRPALVIVNNSHKMTFEVDAIVSQQKVVLKRLGREFAEVPGVVAGAILSNGEPGLVLSLDQLVSWR